MIFERLSLNERTQSFGVETAICGHEEMNVIGHDDVATYEDAAFRRFCAKAAEAVMDCLIGQ
jgi:hypothetical protein